MDHSNLYNLKIYRALNFCSSAHAELGQYIFADAGLFIACVGRFYGHAKMKLILNILNSFYFKILYFHDINDLLCTNTFLIVLFKFNLLK